MNPTDRDEVQRTIDDLAAKLDRIREAVEEAASQEKAPPEGTPGSSHTPPPPPVTQGGPVLRVRSQGESVRAFIAIFVVAFGLGAIVFAWYIAGIGDAVQLAAILLGLIATIAGFYFGQRGATRAQTQAAFAMRGWHTAETRARQLEDWAQGRQ